MLKTIDPHLSENDLPDYPPLAATTESNKINDIRRTIVFDNLDATVSVALWCSHSLHYIFLDIILWLILITSSFFLRLRLPRTSCWSWRERLGRYGMHVSVGTRMGLKMRWWSTLSSLPSFLPSSCTTLNTWESKSSEQLPYRII